MKRTSSVLLILLLAIAVPAPLLAKGQIVKIAITGADLTVPIEITDFRNLKDVDVNVWAGPGVKINGKEQTEGFIIDWPRGAVVDHPSGLQHYEVEFYAKLDEVRLVYVVFYDFNPSWAKLHLPARKARLCVAVCTHATCDVHACRPSSAEFRVAFGESLVQPAFRQSPPCRSELRLPDPQRISPRTPSVWPC